MKTKYCRDCNTTKTFGEFYSDIRKPDGRSQYCKVCSSIRNKQWKQAHKERCNEHYKKFISKNRTYYKDWIKAHPWYRTKSAIWSRLNNPDNVSYKRYTSKGITNSLTIENLKFLWFRDKAYLMKRPSIDRKNAKENYTLENCRYMELADNIRRRFTHA